eukprot:TRINITY_DN11149_c0_g1_i1.p1 TRINITY_DN11149_c0_g1~~TRINITY_DN11149_c0_g1_i1.p1  ORF type:complete len:368 (+),score=73.21 TRINITY_DN11149_c0_g1_i1:314-1417(+)
MAVNLTLFVNNQVSTLPLEQLPKFDNLDAIVKTLFPSILGNVSNIAYSYIDEDGDVILIGSDDELLEAFRIHNSLTNDHTLPIYVRSTDETEPSSNLLGSISSNVMAFLPHVYRASESVISASTSLVQNAEPYVNAAAVPLVDYWNDNLSGHVNQISNNVVNASVPYMTAAVPYVNAATPYVTAATEPMVNLLNAPINESVSQLSTSFKNASSSAVEHLNALKSTVSTPENFDNASITASTHFNALKELVVSNQHVNTLKEIIETQEYFTAVKKFSDDHSLDEHLQFLQMKISSLTDQIANQDQPENTTEVEVPPSLSDSITLPQNSLLIDLQALEEMGFYDRVKNLELLEKYEGDLIKVTSELLES